MAAGRKPDEAPPGEKALSALPAAGPPPNRSRISRTGRPMVTWYTPGRATWPDSPTILGFSARHQEAPRARMAGTQARVSTLLTRVGCPSSPAVPGKGGLLRGSARRYASASSRAVSSPQM